MWRNFIKKLKRKRLFFIISFVTFVIIVFVYTALYKPLFQVKATVKVENSFGIEPTSVEVISQGLAKLGLLGGKHPEAAIANVKNKISVNKDQASGIIEIIIKGDRPNELTNLAKEITNTYLIKINEKAGQMKEGLFKKKRLELEEYKKNLKEQLAKAKERLEEYEKQVEQLEERERGTVERVSDLKAKLAELEAVRTNLLKVYTAAYPDVVRADSEIATVKEKLKNMPEGPEGRLKLEREFKDNQKIYDALREKWDEANLKNIEDLKDVKGGATLINYAEQPILATSAVSRRLIIFYGILAAVFFGMLVSCAAVFLDTSLISQEEVFVFSGLAVWGNVPYIKSFRFKNIKNKADLLLEYNSESEIIEPYKLIYMHIQSDIFTNNGSGKTIFFTSALKGEGKTIVASNLALTLAKAGRRVLIIDANLANPAMHLLFGIPARIPGFTDVLNKGVTVEKVMRDVTDLLLGGIGLKAALKFKGLDRLKIITIGSPISDATELLRSEKMRGLMEELKLQFDYIILDGPSVLNNSDSVIIASESDATLLVYSAGRTSRSSLRVALARLHYGKVAAAEAKISLKGIILNRCI